eukprot:CAMPEP_0172367970 /NCGR_PEP_ID=MMETSP1060-20121228/24843_1 /TAXON_ID=37318 /ORGANISM="Pseudo-nitzschia pungens, Strain cf. cingulata" /LENGTH=664 /DNA_ID=CAMNT_0013092423 /DNA_START=237 /DNA_END=2231 /DNA_ORIENTATION=-
MNIYTLHKEGSFQPPNLLQKGVLPTVAEESNSREKSTSSGTSRTGVESLSSSGEKTATHKNNVEYNNSRNGKGAGATAAKAITHESSSSRPPAPKRLSSTAPEVLAGRMAPSSKDWNTKIHQLSTEDHYNRKNDYKRFAASLIEIQAKNEFMVFENDTDLVSHLTIPPEIRSSPLGDNQLIIDHKEFRKQDDLVSVVSLPRALRNIKQKHKQRRTHKSKSNGSVGSGKKKYKYDKNGKKLEHKKKKKKKSSGRKEKKASKKEANASHAGIGEESKTAKSVPIIQKEEARENHVSFTKNESILVISQARLQEQQAAEEELKKQQEGAEPHSGSPTNENKLDNTKNNSASHKSNGSSGRSSKKSSSTRRGGRRHTHPLPGKTELSETTNQGQSLFRTNSFKENPTTAYASGEDKGPTVSLQQQPQPKHAKDTDEKQKKKRDKHKKKKKEKRSTSGGHDLSIKSACTQQGDNIEEPPEDDNVIETDDENENENQNLCSNRNMVVPPTAAAAAATARSLKPTKTPSKDSYVDFDIASRQDTRTSKSTSSADYTSKKWWNSHMDFNIVSRQDTRTSKSTTSVDNTSKKWWNSHVDFDIVSRQDTKTSKSTSSTDNTSKKWWKVSTNSLFRKKKMKDSQQTGIRSSSSDIGKTSSHPQLQHLGTKSRSSW